MILATASAASDLSLELDAAVYCLIKKNDLEESGHFI